MDHFNAGERDVSGVYKGHQWRLVGCALLRTLWIPKKSTLRPLARRDSPPCTQDRLSRLIRVNTALYLRARTPSMPPIYYITPSTNAPPPSLPSSSPLTRVSYLPLLPLLRQSPPLTMPLLLLQPQNFPLLPFFPPLAPRKEPLFARQVLLAPRRVADHAAVHRETLRATRPGGGDGAVEGAGCEVWDRRGGMSAWKEGGREKDGKRKEETFYLGGAVAADASVVQIAHLGFLRGGEGQRVGCGYWGVGGRWGGGGGGGCRGGGEGGGVAGWWGTFGHCELMVERVWRGRGRGGGGGGC